MPVVIFRHGVAVAVPPSYADTPQHKALVAELSTPSFQHAILTLETAPAASWLAADVLTGAAWARRYLNTVALLNDKRQADRALKALVKVLSGREVKRGRHRTPPLSTEQAARAAAAVAAWRAVVDRVWTADRAALGQALHYQAEARKVALAHRRALSALVRRKALRRSDVVLALAAWEVGVPVRRIRETQKDADFVYG